MDPIEVILRVFDCTDSYGPVSNLTRIERFERAERMGLGPSKEVSNLLRFWNRRVVIRGGNKVLLVMDMTFCRLLRGA